MINSSTFLEKLTEFNQALVYGFDPEASDHDYMPQTIEYLYHGADQYRDIFNAYLFAQDTILNHIKTKGIASVTPEMLLGWIKTIHFNIAATLARDLNVSAGQYPNKDQQIVRFHPDAGIKEPIGIALWSLLNEDTIKSIVDTLPFDEKVNREEICAFLRVAKKYQVLTPQVRSAMNVHQGVADHTFQKLFEAVNKNQLSVDELKAVNKVFTLGHLPEKIPGLMAAYIDRTLKAWKACNPSDTKAVAKLVSDAFSEFTSIHPFFNGNGRTATCLINVMLRSLGYPSILMRNPRERDDALSSYSKAISELAEGKTEFLEQHIHQRITLKKEEAFVDNHLKQVILLRIALRDLLKHFQSMLPNTSFADVYLKSLKETFCDSAVNDEQSEKVIAVLHQVNNLVYKKSNELGLKSEEGKSKLKTTMQRISGFSEWKMTTKDNECTLWRQCSKEEKDRLLTMLQSSPSFTSDHNVVTARGVLGKESTFVVMVSKIDFYILSKTDCLAPVRPTEGPVLRK